MFRACKVSGNNFLGDFENKDCVCSGGPDDETIVSIARPHSTRQSPGSGRVKEGLLTWGFRVEGFSA